MALVLHKKWFSELTTQELYEQVGFRILMTWKP